MTTIIVNHENNQIDEHDFASEINTITIGRRSTNDVCIPNLSVSGMHAKIVISDDGAMIEDLGSTNGTYINGRLISRQLLNDGDDIVMGKTRVTFLQPSQNKAKASPVIIQDDDLLDERPLTLAEKAKIHKTRPQANFATPTDNAANHNSAAGSNAEQDNQLTELLTPTPRLKGSQAQQQHNYSAASNGAKAPAVAPSSHSAGLDDAVINGFDQIESESSLSHAETIHNGSKPDHDMISLDSENVTATASAVIEIKNGAKSGQVLPIDKPVTTLGRPGIQIAAIMKKPEGYFLMHIESDDNIGPPQLNKSSIGDEPVLLKSGDALNVAGIDVQFMQS